MNDSKILSFLHPIDPSYMPGYKVISRYSINVTYKLHYNGKVEVIQYGLSPDVITKVARWDKLHEEINKAAEKDSTKYLRPGQYRGRKEMPQPGEDIYFDAEQEMKRH